MSQYIRNSEKRSLLLVALVFGVVGVVPLLLGIYIYQQRSLFVAEANSAQGVVVEIFLATSNARTGGEDIKTYAPRVVFFAASNQKVEFRSRASKSDPGYKVGDQVPVLYDPATPEKAKINTFFHLWMLPTIMIAMGGLFSTIAILVAILDWKERRHQKRG